MTEPFNRLSLLSLSKVFREHTDEYVGERISPISPNQQQKEDNQMICKASSAVHKQNCGIHHGLEYTSDPKTTDSRATQQHW